MSALALLSIVMMLGAAQPEPTVLVLPLEARNGISAELAETVSASLMTELRKHGRHVVALRDVEAAFTQEQRRQLADCAGGACALEIGGAVNAEDFIGGSIGRIGNSIVINIARIDARTATAKARIGRRIPVGRESTILDELPGIAAELLSSGPIIASVVAKPAGVPMRRIAVLYFDNHGGPVELDPLRKGLADMLITDLKQCGSLQVIEREKLNAVLDELKLQKRAEIDVATAQRIGRLLGVEYLLLGSFFEVLGQFRIDARLVRVETAEVAMAQGVSGKKESFMELEKELVLKVIASLGAPLDEKERRQIDDGHQGRWADAMQYSRAVEAYDAGDRKTAREASLSLHERMPGFKPLRDLLRKLEAP